MGKRKIILDFDPGIDDAFAFLWLSHFVREGVIDLLAITTIAGNKPSRICCQNAFNLVHAVNLTSIPIGCHPFEDERSCHESNFHGIDGFQGAGQYLTTVDIPWDGLHEPVKLMKQKINENPGEITLLVLGPATNVRILLDEMPQLFKENLIKEIVVMGGGLNVRGNTKPNAEYNFWYDSDSAQRLVAESFSLVLMPLDVTTSVCFSEEISEIQSMTSSKLNSERAQNLLKFMVEAYSGENTKIQAWRWHQPCLYLHDSLVVAYLLKPWLFSFTRRYISVTKEGSVDFEFRKAETMLNANAWVAHDLHRLDFKWSLRTALVDLLFSIDSEESSRDT